MYYDFSQLKLLILGRHLAILNRGLTPKVYYPKPTKKPLYENLVKQGTTMNIDFLEDLPPPDQIKSNHQLIVDALFGFSFKVTVKSLQLHVLRFN